MKKCYFLAILLLIGCAEVSLPDQFDAEHNRLNWAELTQGMNKSEVRDIMGDPAWKEVIHKGHSIYEAWFYLMDGLTIMTEKKFPRKCYSPVILKDGILTGWGYPYYNIVFNVLETRQKYREEMGNQQDTTQPTDWPSGQQQLLKPPEKKPTLEGPTVEKPVKSQETKPIEKLK